MPKGRGQELDLGSCSGGMLPREQQAGLRQPHLAPLPLSPARGGTVTLPHVGSLERIQQPELVGVAKVSSGGAGIPLWDIPCSGDTAGSPKAASL